MCNEVLESLAQFTQTLKRYVFLEAPIMNKAGELSLRPRLHELILPMVAENENKLWRYFLPREECLD